MCASRCGTVRTTYHINSIVAENAKLQPNYRETSGKLKMRTVLKQNKTKQNSEEWAISPKIPKLQKGKKKSLQRYSRLKDAKETRHQRKIPVINKERCFNGYY